MGEVKRRGPWWWLVPSGDREAFARRVSMEALRVREVTVSMTPEEIVTRALARIQQQDREAAK